MRVLFWNIENFSKKRVCDATGETEQERNLHIARSMANARYILGTVTQADADLFVVIEARCDQGDVEQLAEGDGPEGLRFLLTRLRNRSPSWRWNLVPPLRINPRDPLGTTRTETVGVFWRGQRLDFTGPYLWPAGRANATGPPIPGPGGGGAYPAPWNNAVPAGVNAAARCRFYGPGGTEVTFNDYMHRRPFLTTFAERLPNGAHGRTVNLYTVHLKPSDMHPTAASTALSELMETTPPPAGHLNLIVGDFNLDLIVPDWKEKEGLKQWNDDWAQYEPIFPAFVHASMIKDLGQARPQDYLGTRCVDFGLVKYGVGARPPAGQGPAAVIVDRVMGTVAVPPLPPFSTDMFHPMFVIAGLPDIDRQEQVFRMPLNYGHISPPLPGTSDHLPVLLQV